MSTTCSPIVLGKIPTLVEVDIESIPKTHRKWGKTFIGGRELQEICTILATLFQNKVKTL